MTVFRRQVDRGQIKKPSRCTLHNDIKNGRQAGQRASGCGQRCRARQGSQTCELDLRRSAAIHQSVCRVTRLYAPLARSIITLTQFAAELVRRALQSIARCEVSPVDDAGSAAVLYVVSKCEGKWCRPTAGARTRMSCMDVGASAHQRRHPCTLVELLALL